MIRFATAADTTSVRALWDACFPDEGGFNDYYFRVFYRPEWTLLLTEGDDLCAMLQMRPYTLLSGGEPQQATYIYGACTSPAHRREKRMSQLLEHSFLLDRQLGRTVSFLIPQEQWLFDFYAPFGYHPFFTISHGIMQKDSQLDAEIPFRLTTKDIPQLNTLYEAAAFDVHPQRASSYWADQLTLFDQLGGGAYGWRANGRLTAYAFSWLPEIQECLGLTPAQEQGLLQTLGAETLPFTTPGSDLAFGCIKWHDGSDRPTNGYLNLMLN